MEITLKNWKMEKTEQSSEEYDKLVKEGNIEVVPRNS
jgi:hypothetical protein